MNLFGLNKCIASTTAKISVLEQEKVQRRVGDLKDATRKIGPMINEDKTKYMTVGQDAKLQ